ncbi:unnamed protein product [Adineta ricciae]|uniref:Uncharacterized protein n=1 Tax=Adineta ricciae TaxID=249248 RepID=A0A815NME0_ADIRI|nr:unnamed protein product [Adineta ricciae]
MVDLFRGLQSSSTFVYFIVHSFLFTVHSDPTIGKVSTARFTSIDQLNTGTTWISNQLTVEQCLCTALLQYTNVLLFNSYSNGSCQLFFALPYTYTMEYRNDSTIILLSPLPPRDQAPCCSNLPWLMSRIVNSSTTTLTLKHPSHLIIDDFNYLVVLYNSYTVNRYSRSTMLLNSTISVGVFTEALSYYNRQYFLTKGISHTSDLAIYSMDTLANTATVGIARDPRDYVFIRNGSIMVVSIQTLQLISFYNVISPTSYTLAFSLSAPEAPNKIYRVNDSLLYITTLTTNRPIYTLTYDSTDNNWTWGSLPATTSDIGEGNFQVIMDACGRLWTSVENFGIRIFDRFGTKCLYNWSLSIGLNGIVFGDQFFFSVADYDNNEVFSYQPEISQCTS